MRHIHHLSHTAHCVIKSLRAFISSLLVRMKGIYRTMYIVQSFNSVSNWTDLAQLWKKNVRLALVQALHSYFYFYKQLMAKLLLCTWFCNATKLHLSRLKNCRNNLREECQLWTFSHHQFRFIHALIGRSRSLSI